MTEYRIHQTNEDVQIIYADGFDMINQSYYKFFVQSKDGVQRVVALFPREFVLGMWEADAEEDPTVDEDEVEE